MVSQKPKYCKNFERNSHWRKLSMIMAWERYCNASPKPEFILFSLFIFSFISQLILVRLDWNFHRWFSIQKQSKLMYNWCFLFVVLHKPTLLPSTFNVYVFSLKISKYSLHGCCIMRVRKYWTSVMSHSLSTITTYYHSLLEKKCNLEPFLSRI